MKMYRFVLPAVIAMTSLMSTAQAQDFQGTLKKVADTGVITVGYRETSVPFSYLDSNQKPIGYSIDLCHKIIEDVEQVVGKELEVRYVAVTPSTRIPLMANGTIDLECGSTTNKLSRQEQVEYLPVTFITGTKLLVRKGSGIASIEDLEGKTVALAQGTTNEQAVKAAAESLGLNIRVLSVRDHAEGFLALETDRADAYSTDHILLYGLISRAKSPEDFEVVGEFMSYDPYAIMVRRDDSAFELVGKRTLSRLFRTGEINTIYDQWFTPLGVERTDMLNTAFQLQALPE